MSELHSMTRGFLAAGMFLLAMNSPAIAHTDLELQIKALSQQLNIQPDDSDLRLRRGDLYRRHLDYDLARQDFATARSLDPANLLVDFYDGRLALETGEIEQARVFLTRYVIADPYHAAAWVMLGRAQLILNLPSMAARSFAHAIRSSAAPAPGLYRLQALALLADDRTGEGLQAIDSALTRWPTQVNLLGLACDLALAQNQPALAKGYLGRLPDQLFKVDLWRQRADRAACLSDSNTPGGQRSECLVQSKRVVLEQLEHITGE